MDKEDLESEALFKSYKKGEDEDFIISTIRPFLNQICSNSVRACILHMLVKSRDLNHTMQVEELSRKLGKRHSVIIYHLEQLMEWKLVKVVKHVDYGNSKKRSIWGLNLNYPNLIREVYARIVKLFYTQKELDKLCSINKNVRQSL